MARIALGITLLLLLVTAGLEYETWTKIQALNQTLATTKTNLTNANQRAARADADKKVAQDDASKANAAKADAESKAAAAQASLDQANTKLQADDKEIDDLKQQVATISGSSQGPGVIPGAKYTQEQWDEVQTQLKDATSQVAELKQVKDSLTQQKTDADNRAEDLDKIVQHYQKGNMRNGLEGEVLAVNPGWNFVVLSLGDRQGAVANAELILTRNGNQIGKVKIKSVDPSTSVADIVPGSLARGVKVQPGDRVIFQGFKG